MTAPHNGGDHESDGPTGICTWTCTDCPAWAERYWPPGYEVENHPSAAAHTANCPNGGHVVIVHRSRTGPAEHLGAERLLGTYDPNEGMIVPYWTVLAAKSLAGFLARQAERGGRIDLTDDTYLRLITGAVLATDPLPDRAEPTNTQEFAQLFRVS